VSLSHVAGLLAELEVTRRDRDQALANLTSVQERYAWLLLEVQQLRTALVLPGWACTSCLVFNGEAKERLAFCRCCGVRRPA
jgi:hypothetical protein